MATKKNPSRSKPKRSASVARRTNKKAAARAEKSKKRQSEHLGGANRFPVVGIGASAGGLEALKHLFDKMPLDTGLAFVVVQHLDPKHPSMLTELISRVTRLPVVEVTDGINVAPNSVYIIPPNTRMAMMHNTLCLLPRNEDGDHPMPIDYFFNSLATDLKAQAIGVVLSGTASDGTHGLQAIKSGGGITFAQDRNTATYFGMPGSAIDSGVVDLVLPPDRIAEELARIAHRPIPMFVDQEGSETSVASDTRSLAKIHFLLRTHSGVDFSQYKPTTVNRRIARRMFLRKLENLSDYVGYLTSHPAEVEGLYQDLLIVVTGFFRDSDVFEALKKSIFPQIIREKASRDPVRIWVPGCATGEEAYSIAIALVEHLRAKPTDNPIQIFATDLSELAIRKARAGMYASTIVNDVPPDRLRRFFVKSEEGFQVNKMVRDMCVFATHDLTKDPPFSRLDLISCRNVLIYLGPVLQRRIIPMFHYALNPGGYLMLGNSETIGPFSALFSVADRKRKLYMKKGGLSRAGFRSQMTLTEMNSKAESLEMQVGESGPVHDVQSEMERILISRFSPPGVLVNSAFEIVRYQGHTGLYLQAASGAPSLNILRLAREGLLLELRTGLQQARKRDATIEKKDIPIRGDDRIQFVDLEILPIKAGPSMQDRHFLVLFKPSLKNAALAQDGEEKAGPPKNKILPKAIERLQKELKATRDYLQSTIEEQEATNEELHLALEEIRSSNEELQSTNEEMETAKEELQSTNEELITVNEELRNSNTELNVANSDLVNLLNNISFAVIMIDNEMHIRRFTPAAGQILNLLPADVGRPITDLRLNADIQDLDVTVQNVVATLSPEQIEVRSHTGKMYTMRITPYKTLENQIEGVILSLVDVDDARRAVQRASDAKKALMDFQDSLHVPVIMTDSEFVVLHVNPAFANYFLLSDNEIAGKPLLSAMGGRWNASELKQQLETLRSVKGQTMNLEAEVEVPAQGRRRLRFQGRRIEQEREGGSLLVLTVVEST